MSIFASIMNKIFHHPSAAATPAATSPAPTDAPAAPAAPDAPSASTPVDVGAVLSDMASAKGGGGNYQTSIVDLLKLLDLDSSLDARKTLAQEMNVHAGADGTAEQNVALHKAVVQKLADNGGTIPISMRV